MAQFHPVWDAYQRRRFMRPDAYRYIRPDAHRWLPPGTPRRTGEDVVHYFWPEDPLRPHTKSRERNGRDDRDARFHSDERARQHFHTELLRLRADTAALRFQLEMIKSARLLLKANFNPNQPRVPAGNPDGGQWTSVGAATDRTRAHNDKPPEVVRDRSGEESWERVIREFREDGSLRRETVFNRDGSTIRSEFSAASFVDGWDTRHTVLLNDGSITTFQNDGLVQTVFDGNANQLSQTVWTPEGAEPTATVQPVFWQEPVRRGAQIAIQKSIEAGAALFTWLSSQNTPDKTAALEFRAREFALGPGPIPEQWSITAVRQLTQEQVKQFCEKYDDVQRRLDEAADKVRTDGKYRDQKDFGTKVHKLFADGINALGDENYIAEVSVYKSLEAAGKNPNREPHHGMLDTVRVDALENRPEFKIVCGYDPKTGKKRLTLPRMLEFVTGVKKKYPYTLWIYMMEMREQRP
jgi:hypothetical protein